MATARNDDFPHIPEMSREQFLSFFPRTWQQSEHVAIIGPTGTGKTTLTRDLLSARDYVVVFAVKPKDDTLDLFTKRKQGHQTFKIIKQWPPKWTQHHVVLNIPPENLRDTAEQREKVFHALADIYKAGGWCTSFDDLSYVTNTLKLREEIKVFMNQGRSSMISAVNCVTRPFQVPTEAFNQTSWTLLFGFDDERETDRAAELAAMPHRQMREIQRSLGLRDFIVRHRPTRTTFIVRQHAQHSS